VSASSSPPRSGVDRHLDYTCQIAKVERAGQLFVLVDRTCATSVFRAALEAAAASYRVDDVARWSLIWDIQAPTGGDAEALLALRTAIAARQSC
jgi:Flp pilus assembly protein TadB